MLFKKISEKFIYFSNRLKLISKNRVNTFKDKNKQETLALIKIERFCSTNIFIAKNWDSYQNGNFSKTWIIISLIPRVTLLLFFIRYIACALFGDNQFIRSIFSDGLYLLGNSKLISIYILNGTFLGLCMGQVYNYYELKGRLFVISQ